MWQQPNVKILNIVEKQNLKKNPNPKNKTQERTQKAMSDSSEMHQSPSSGFHREKVSSQNELLTIEHQAPQVFLKYFDMSPITWDWKLAPQDTNRVPV